MIDLKDYLNLKIKFNKYFGDLTIRCPDSSRRDWTLEEAFEDACLKAQNIKEVQDWIMLMVDEVAISNEVKKYNSLGLAPSLLSKFVKRYLMQDNDFKEFIFDIIDKHKTERKLKNFK